MTQSSHEFSNRGPLLPVIGERIIRRSASQFGASGSSPVYIRANRSARARSTGWLGSASPK